MITKSTANYLPLKKKITQSVMNELKTHIGEDVHISFYTNPGSYNEFAYGCWFRLKDINDFSNIVVEDLHTGKDRIIKFIAEDTFIKYISIEDKENSQNVRLRLKDVYANEFFAPGPIQLYNINTFRELSFGSEIAEKLAKEEPAQTLRH